MQGGGSPQPWTPGIGCNYYITITTQIGENSNDPPPNPPQGNQQMFIQFCNTASSCEYTSGLTPDINEPGQLTATHEFQTQFSGADINYVKVEHCSIYPGGPPGCKTQLNQIGSYTIAVSLTP